uniref:MANSC domain-containing protein n=1 Tax=Lepeophtheirus salmonis TaxID=72036 RepID=A0A0K2T9E8_LEPSM
MQILYVFLSLCLYAECMKEKAHYLSLDNQSKKVSKRRIINSGLGRGEDLLLDRFDQNHCINKFETSSQTVILAKESQDNGAFFINETAAYSYKSCFKNCCETLGCNTAVWDQNTNFCYLFDCGSREDFKCYFDSHNMFTSGLLRVERSDLDMESRDYHRTHLQSLNPTRDQYSILQDEEGEAVKEECGRYQFQCHSGECVAIYDVCNGIPQCRDASDEDPQECPSTTPATIRTTPLPSTLQTLFPVSPERTQNNYRMEPSLFHHKNAGIQVANNAPYAYQPILK